LTFLDALLVAGNKSRLDYSEKTKKSFTIALIAERACYTTIGSVNILKEELFKHLIINMGPRCSCMNKEDGTTFYFNPIQNKEADEKGGRAKASIVKNTSKNEDNQEELSLLSLCQIGYHFGRLGDQS
jgi:hypothetical protein